MTPTYIDPLVQLYLGDCLEVLPTLEAESVDAIVTDPPYGLGFMGKHWDHGVPNADFWTAMYRVAKPGAYLLAFGGTRTVHRIATNIEDSGWIIRDMLAWIYASGFPKGKANLKPAHEPIVLARKPGKLRPLAIDECRIGLTGDEAVDGRDGEPTADTRYGDKMRATPGKRIVRKKAQPADVGILSQGERPVGEIASANVAGRWPSNVLLSDPELLDESNPYVVGSGVEARGSIGSGPRPTAGTFGPMNDNEYADSGGYSRFFIIPKADRHERERGLNAKHLPERGPVHSEALDVATRTGSSGDRADQIARTAMSRMTRRDGLDRPQERTARANVHPTVKPIDLMRHLVRLVTPVDGVVLDPFLGSGTTALAASEEGFRCIGIEREAEYLEIAKGRLMATPMGLGLDTPISQPSRKLDPRVIAGKGPSRPEGASASTWFTTGHSTDEEPAA